jgi:hypothetical protein
MWPRAFSTPSTSANLSNFSLNFRSAEKRKLNWSGRAGARSGGLVRTGCEPAPEARGRVSLPQATVILPARDVRRRRLPSNRRREHRLAESRQYSRPRFKSSPTIRAIGIII